MRRFRSSYPEGCFISGSRFAAKDCITFMMPTAWCQRAVAGILKRILLGLSSTDSALGQITHRTMKRTFHTSHATHWQHSFLRSELPMASCHETLVVSAAQCLLLVQAARSYPIDSCSFCFALLLLLYLLSDSFRFCKHRCLVRLRWGQVAPKSSCCFPASKLLSIEKNIRIVLDILDV